MLVHFDWFYRKVKNCAQEGRGGYYIYFAEVAKVVVSNEFCSTFAHFFYIQKVLTEKILINASFAAISGAKVLRNLATAENFYILRQSTV